MKKTLIKKKPVKLTKGQLQGLQARKLLESIRHPSHIKDAVKWLHANR